MKTLRTVGKTKLDKVRKAEMRKEKSYRRLGSGYEEGERNWMRVLAEYEYNHVGLNASLDMEHEIQEHMND